jgi:hypothetical protein
VAEAACMSNITEMHRQVTEQLQRIELKLDSQGSIGRGAKKRENAVELTEVAVALYVFHRGGAPIGDFRKSWARACYLAAYPVS